MRTVDDQAERDGVDDDQHGHGGLALALGAFGAGVLVESFLGASEKGAHGGAVVGNVDCVTVCVEEWAPALLSKSFVT